MSRIVTFYSYKGGVGRTLALANIGVLLARQGKRVLLIDWDLEAPGLDRYFQHHIDQPSATQGLVHLLHEASASPHAGWRSHVQNISIKPNGAFNDKPYRLSIIPSGVASSDYSFKVRAFSWTTFMEEKNGGPILELWREEWKRNFDFILIDSRTGITDSGGICTVLLPDLLVLVFTANEQSFEGALSVSQSVQIERRNLAVQRPPLTILPLLSRFDGREEVDMAKRWLAKFNAKLKPLFDDWLPRQFQPLQVIELTKIPYVTLFSFGEPLPVVSHSLTDPELPGFYLENAARLLASDFRDVARIIDPETQGTTFNVRAQILELVQREPLDETDVRRLLSVAEEESHDPTEFVALLSDVGIALRQRARSELGDSPELAALFSDIGEALRLRGRFEAAEPLMRRALTLAEQSYGATHPSVAVSLNNLVRLLQETGRLTDAEPFARRALAIDEESFGKQHRKVATDLNNLAQLLYNNNEPLQAEPFMRQALEIEEKVFGPNSSVLATGLNNLAQLLQETNQLVEAEALMRRALAIDEQAYGADHSTVAVRLNNLAHLLAQTNRLTEAETLLRRALEIEEKYSGPEHPTVAICSNNLALLLADDNRLAEAEPLMRRAIAIDERCFGPDHSTVAADLGNLASLLRKANRITEAESLMRRALAIDEANYGIDHYNISLRLNDLAQLLKSTDRLRDAEPLIRRALAIEERTYGHEHPAVAVNLVNLVHVLRAQNELVEAEPLAYRAIKILKRLEDVAGHTHPYLDTATSIYTTVLNELGKTAEDIKAKIDALNSHDSNK